MLTVESDIYTMHICMYYMYVSVCVYIISASFPHPSKFYFWISVSRTHTLVVFRLATRLPLSHLVCDSAPESCSEHSSRSSPDCDRPLGTSPWKVRTCYSKAVRILLSILDCESFLIIPWRGGTIFSSPSYVNWTHLHSSLTECSAIMS